jgi:hypothetical protein
MAQRTARLEGPHQVVADTAEACASSRPTPSALHRSRPRIPTGPARRRPHPHTRCLPAQRPAAPPGGDRPGRPASVRPHVLVAGQRGVAARPRQQVLPEGPEVAATESSCCAGASTCSKCPGRRHRPARGGGGRALRGRAATAATRRWPSGRSPTATGWARRRGVEVDASGYVPINHHCITNVSDHAAGTGRGSCPRRRWRP